MIRPNLLATADALELLEKIQPASVDLVYLDPPLPTYPDPFKGDTHAYSTFLYRVLQQTYRVLKNTGHVFIYCRLDLNLDFRGWLVDVFGKAKYATEYVIPLSMFSNAPAIYTHSHASILVYKRSGEGSLQMAYRMRNSEFINSFNHTDEKGKFRLASLTVSRPRPYFTTVWKNVTPPAGHSWRYNFARLDELYEQGMIYQNERGALFLKQYLDAQNLEVPVGTLWDDLPKLNYRPHLSHQQAVEWLERVVQIGTTEGQTVLDPFCGAGTTLLACLRLNRQFIACDHKDKAIKICNERIQKEQPQATYFAIDKSSLARESIVWNDYKTYGLQEEEEIMALVSKGETDTVEFKESACWNRHLGQKDPTLIDNVTKSVAAFLNTGGGTLFIGVTNDRNLQDLQPDYAAADTRRRDRDGYIAFLTGKIRRKLGPPALHKYNIQFFTIDHCDICRIQVWPSKEFVFWDHHFFCRVDNSTRSLTCEEFLKYLKNKGVI